MAIVHNHPCKEVTTRRQHTRHESTIAVTRTHKPFEVGVEAGIGHRIPVLARIRVQVDHKGVGHHNHRKLVGAPEDSNRPGLEEDLKCDSDRERRTEIQYVTTKARIREKADGTYSEGDNNQQVDLRRNKLCWTWYRMRDE